MCLLQSTYDFGKFKKLDQKVMDAADNALQSGIPLLLRQLSEENDARAAHEKAVVAQYASSALVGGDGAGGGAAGDSGATGAGATGGGSASAGNPFGGVVGTVRCCGLRARVWLRIER